MPRKDRDRVTLTIFMPEWLRDKFKKRVVDLRHTMSQRAVELIQEDVRHWEATQRENAQSDMSRTSERKPQATIARLVAAQAEETFARVTAIPEDRLRAIVAGDRPSEEELIRIEAHIEDVTMDEMEEMLHRDFPDLSPENPSRDKKNNGTPV